MTLTPRGRELRVLVAPDSFKGSVGSVDASRALEAGVLSCWPGASVRRLPMADGGEGTLSAIACASPEATVEIHRVRGPLGPLAEAPLLWLPDREVAVVELASVVGPHRVPSPDPSTTTTWGVGQLISTARAGGAQRTLVGAGGSATVDGGAGALQALGFRLFDEMGAPIGPGIVGLEALHGIEPPAQSPSGLEILCDVQSPLLGLRGAARLYGPQKGASPDLVERAEVAMERFAERLTEVFGRDPRSQTGAGAAGGFAGGLWSACSALLCPGAQVVAELVHLAEEVSRADLVITGEGCVDGQTGEGKLVAGIQAVCAQADVPLAVVAGQTTEAGREWCDDRGLIVIELGERADSIQERIRRAPELLEQAGRLVMTRFAALP